MSKPGDIVCQPSGSKSAEREPEEKETENMCTIPGKYDNDELMTMG